MSDHILQFHIDYSSEEHGWIDCYLTCDDFTHHMEASGAIPPFHELLDFLRLITLNRLPASFYWDEEGFGSTFEAWPLGQQFGSNNPDFHLRIIQESIEYEFSEADDSKPLVNAYRVLGLDDTFNREAVVDVFFPPLCDFVLYSQQPDEWNISLQDILAFEQLRARNVPPRSDITHTEPVELLLERRQSDTKRWGTQSIELHMWGMMLDRWSLDDTDQFWPQWFELLEHALTGRPYEMSFVSMFSVRLERKLVADGSMKPEEVGPPSSTRICATPLDHPRHFRLQIHETDYRYTDLLRVDEVIDAVHLTNEFLKKFENLLNDRYQPYPDEDGLVFDLRELPVEHLKEILRNIQ